MTNNITPLTIENFQAIIGEQSASKLVVVYFWAPWDEASVAQLEVTKQFVQKHPDTIVLATVNCDEQQQIVGQFGVRGLPTTMLVQNGQPIDGFAGPQDESQLSQTFEKYLPKPEEQLLNDAQAKIAENDYEGAFVNLKQAFEICSDRADIVLAYADTAIELGNLSLAKELVAQIGLVDQDASYHALIGKIELAEKAAESPELIQLQNKLEQDPNNLDVKIELAVHLQQAHKAEEGLSLLFEVVKQDINYKEAKKTMLDMINALTDGDPLKSVYRRKVYSLLY